MNDWPEGRFRTVVIDPPWPYRQKLTGARVRGGAAKHYPAMAMPEILALPVATLLAEDAMVWVWTTNSHSHEAFHCIEAWGLQYRSMVTWGKTRFGLGYWLRGQTEHCLLATVGRPRTRLQGPNGAIGGNWSTLIVAKPGLHSSKPQVFMDMAEEIWPRRWARSPASNCSAGIAGSAGRLGRRCRQNGGTDARTAQGPEGPATGRPV